MWDLDNLKYINDTYGHDEGDRYIVLFASCLKRLEKEGAIVSRYSGDEFVTLIYGSGGKEEIRHRVTGFMQFLQTVSLEMKGGYQIPIRVSGGMAWYPDDAVDFDTLLNYADFAMYMVKHSVKGIIMEFDSNDYSNNSYMLAGREELNRMLETREVDFAFQPITRRGWKRLWLRTADAAQFYEFKGNKGGSESGEGTGEAYADGDAYLVCRTEGCGKAGSGGSAGTDGTALHQFHRQRLYVEGGGERISGTATAAICRVL